MNYGSFYFAGWSTLNAKALSNLFHALLVSFDHLLDHLAADGTGLAGGQVAVVALLEVDADLPWCSSSILRAKFICETSKTSRRILFNLHRFIRV